MTRFPRRSLPFLLVLPALASQQALAQEEASAPAGEEEVAAPEAGNPLEPLGRLVGGQWGPMEYDILNEYHRFRWGAGNRSMHVATWQASEEGADAPVGSGFLYWDPQLQKIVGTVVIEGACIKEINEVEITDRQWDFKYDYYSGGDVVKTRESFEWDGEDLYNWRILYAEWEWMSLLFGRTEESSAALPLMPTDDEESAYLGILEPLIGNWNKSSAEGGSRTVCYWVIDRSVALARSLKTVDGEEVVTGDAFLYWSHALSSVRFVSVQADGDVFRGTVAKVGDALEFEFIQVGADGTRYLERIELPTEEGDNTLRAKSWVIRGGERQPMGESVFTPAS